MMDIKSERRFIQLRGQAQSVAGIDLIDRVVRRTLAVRLLAIRW
jgi:hypothetical protein